MNLRPALLVAAALATASWICLALCPWGAPRNRDPVSFAWEVQRGDGLERDREAGMRRAEARRALASEVVAGGMSLREAAGYFRRLGEADPANPAGIPPPPEDEAGLDEWVLDAVWEVLAQDHQFAAATRWYAKAFAAHPDLLPGSATDRRYSAARAAVLAGCGKGRGAADLDEASRAGFRRQALEWLRAELEVRRRLLERGPAQAGAIVPNMKDWLWDIHLAWVRGPEALAKLPESERQAWQKLWTDVADTLARAQ
jgi:hypothetical protein